MKLYLTMHSQKRISQRIKIKKLILCLYKIFFCGEGVEVIENRKSYDFSKYGNLDYHKILVCNELLVFNEDMSVLITVNPSPLSKFKVRRSQGFKKYIKGELK